MTKLTDFLKMPRDEPKEKGMTARQLIKRYFPRWYAEKEKHLSLSEFMERTGE